MSVCLVVVVEVLGCFVKEVWIEERIIDCENRLLFDLRKREWENVEISRKNLLESRLADREVCPVIADMSFPLVGFCRPWIVFCNCLRTNSLVHRAGWKLDYRREKSIDHVDELDEGIYLKQFIMWLFNSSDWRHSAGVKLGTSEFMRLFGSEWSRKSIRW